MRKKIIVGLAVVLFSIFALANNAFADFTNIYMTDADGSFTGKTVFDWNETPWLYLDLPSSALTYAVSWWNPVDTETFFSKFSITSGTDQVWHTLDNWFDDPGGSRQLGYWNIRADYSSALGAGTGNTNFTVTPEPVSGLLFLVGGAGLFGFGHIGRKKS